jgi:predicted tellurium resistance membrane protein TerC
MKFSNGTEFHNGTPKYSKTINRLCKIGIFLAFLCRLLFLKTPIWVSEIGWLMIVAALVVLLVDTIAERKEWEEKQNTDAK